MIIQFQFLSVYNSINYALSFCSTKALKKKEQSHNHAIFFPPVYFFFPIFAQNPIKCCSARSSYIAFVLAEPAQCSCKTTQYCRLLWKMQIRLRERVVSKWHPSCCCFMFPVELNNVIYGGERMVSCMSLRCRPQIHLEKKRRWREREGEGKRKGMGEVEKRT